MAFIPQQLTHHKIEIRLQLKKENSLILILTQIWEELFFVASIVTSPCNLLFRHVKFNVHDKIGLVSRTRRGGRQ